MKVRWALLFLAGSSLGAVAYFFLRGAHSAGPNPAAEKATRQICQYVKQFHPDGTRFTEQEIRAALSRGEVVPGDPSSAVLADATALELSASPASEPYDGIGVSVERRAGERDLAVLTVFPGSPAETAGLAPGARIVSIEGRPAAGTALALATARLAGEPGSALRLAFWEPGGGALREKTLIRQPVRPPVLRGIDLGERVVGVRIGWFYDTLAVDLANTLKGTGGDPRGVVLDLRDCGGGSVTVALEAASLFLPSGTVLAELHGPRWGAAPDALVTRGGADFAGAPVCCLVNRRTASAAEILAGGLAAAKRARLIGERTFGKAAVQDRFPFDGGVLLLTVGRYRFVDGRGVEGGLAPEVAIDPASVGALDAARDLLLKR